MMRAAMPLMFAALAIAGCNATDPSAGIESAGSTGQERMEDFLKSDRYKAAVEKEMQRIAEEKATLEPADWIGQTGLPEDIERELPRYLRRELGQSLREVGSLRAEDLIYVGSFAEPSAKVHYWRLPAAYSSEPVFAYVVVADDAFSFGWSDRAPLVG